MCSNKLKEAGFRELETFINTLDTKKGSLISVLHKAQGIFGYLPREVQEFVADKLNESLANVYGVVSFYSYFTMVPKGEHAVAVCMGTACYVRGADKVLNEFCELHKDKVILMRFKYNESNEEIIKKLNEILNESKKEKN